MAPLVIPGGGQALTGNPALAFGTATTTTTDGWVEDSKKVVFIRMSITPPATTDFFCFVDVSGTGIYGVDWRIKGATAQGGNTYAFQIPKDRASFKIPIEINENHDASETYIMELLRGYGYRVDGAHDTHTITCTSYRTRPQHTDYLAPGYVGHNPTTALSFVEYAPNGGVELAAHGTLVDTIVRGGLGIQGAGCVVTNSWITGYVPGSETPNKFVGPEIDQGDTSGCPGAVFENCSIGALTSDGSGWTAVGRHGLGQGSSSPAAQQWTFRRCYFGRIFQDHIKGGDLFPGNSSVLFEDCMFERAGSDDAAHTDIYQVSKHNDGTDVSITFRNCYLLNSFYEAPGYFGHLDGVDQKPWHCNAIMQLDFEYGNYRGNVVFDRCWIDGGNICFSFDTTKMLGQVIIHNCKMGNQNGAWLGASTEPTKDEVANKYGIGGPVGRPFVVSGCKWGGDWLLGGYAGTEFDLNNTPAF